MADETLTWNQIYRTLADALGVEYRPYYVASEYIDAVAPEGYDMMGNLIGDKAVSVVFDCSKLRRAVPDFTTHVCYAEGCRRAVAHILAHPELQVPDPVFDQWCDRLIATLEDAKAKMK